MEDPSKDSKQGSAYGGETLSGDDSQDTSCAPDETETTEGSLDERAPSVGEGQYEDTSRLTPSPIFPLHSSFSSIFFSLALYFPFFRLHRD